MKYVLFLSAFIALLVGIAHAEDWYESAGHPGTFCAPCHQRFSERSPYAVGIPKQVKNPEVIAIFPCSKPGCHQYNRAIPLPVRWQRHLGICGNCHPQKAGKYDVHNIHLNFSLLQPPWALEYPTNQSPTLREKPVECKICHATPEGFNSSVATVPPWNASLPRIPGSILKPPWNNDCSYCHPAAKDATRLHDVHTPVIILACPVCHTSKIFTRQDFLGAVAGEKSLIQMKIIEIKEEFLLIKEFRAYFYDIADQIIEIYVSLFKGSSRT